MSARIMQSKFPGTCRDCGASVPRGATIAYHGRGLGISCSNCHYNGGPDKPKRPDGACWECKDPNGYFRSYGAATPVYCDACEKEVRSKQWKIGNVLINAPKPEHDEDEAAGLEPGTLANDRRLARHGLTVTRTSSGWSGTRNSRGRCEDAPCCGCCTY